MNNCKENGNKLQMFSFPTVSGYRIFNIDCGRCIPVIIQPGLRFLENRLMLNPIIYVSSLTLSLVLLNSETLIGLHAPDTFCSCFLCKYSISNRYKILGNVIEKKYVSNIRGKHRGLVIRENHWSYSQAMAMLAQGTG